MIIMMKKQLLKNKKTQFGLRESSGINLKETIRKYKPQNCSISVFTYKFKMRHVKSLFYKYLLLFS